MSDRQKRYDHDDYYARDDLLTCPRCGDLWPKHYLSCRSCQCWLVMTAAELGAIQQGRDLLMARVGAEWGQFIDSLPER